jgi:hypothetical protein
VQAVRASLDTAAAHIKATQSDPFNLMSASEQSCEQAVLLEDAAIKVMLHHSCNACNALI